MKTWYASFVVTHSSRTLVQTFNRSRSRQCGTVRTHDEHLGLNYWSPPKMSWLEWHVLLQGSLPAPSISYCCTCLANPR